MTDRNRAEELLISILILSSRGQQCATLEAALKDAKQRGKAEATAEFVKNTEQFVRSVLSSPPPPKEE
jgi:hypothetical protein